MSFILHGIAVSSGIAIGHAHLISHTSLEVAHYTLPAQFVPEEIARFDAALQATRREFFSLRSSQPTHAAAEFDAFLELHQMILDDPLLSVATRQMIEADHCNAEWAIKAQTDALVAQFDEFEDAYLRERQLDVKQVAERLLTHLNGNPGHLPQHSRHDIETVLVARDLSPADLIQFKPQQYAAFLTDVGGATSHTAIVARSLNTPCVVGLHHARELVREDDLLILDGELGIRIVNPDKTVLAEYRLRQSELELERKKLKRLRTARANGSVRYDSVESAPMLRLMTPLPARAAARLMATRASLMSENHTTSVDAGAAKAFTRSDLRAGNGASRDRRYSSDATT